MIQKGDWILLTPADPFFRFWKQPYRVIEIVDDPIAAKKYGDLVCNLKGDSVGVYLRSEHCIKLEPDALRKPKKADETMFTHRQLSFGDLLDARKS